MSQVNLPELAAMQEVANLVADLTPAQKMRVAAWFMEYASQELDDSVVYEAPASVFAAEAEDDAAAAEPQAEDAPATYDTFAQLYEAVAPKTGAQKATVAGYWMETRQNKQAWKASEVNKLLKSIDVKVSSVSIVLTNAVKAADPLITQLARLGDGERSRKTFCITEAGIHFVEDRLA